ncbi:MAG: hypothetical protein ACTSWY_11320 [Promethearchaeota archaeon]
MSKENSDQIKKSPLEKSSLEKALKGKILSEKALQLRLHTDMQLLGQDLEPDARTIMDCFQKPRLILERIQIIFNQTRKMMGVELKTKSELREILEGLKEKGYITIEGFTYKGEEKEAFILTEKGEQLLD